MILHTYMRTLWKEKKKQRKTIRERLQRVEKKEKKIRRAICNFTSSAGETFGVTCVQAKAVGPRPCHAQVHNVDLPGRTAGATTDYARTYAHTYKKKKFFFSSTSISPRDEKRSSLRISEHDAHRIRITPQQIRGHHECQIRTCHLRRQLHPLVQKQLQKANHEQHHASMNRRQPSYHRDHPFRRVRTLDAFVVQLLRDEWIEEFPEP